MKFDDGILVFFLIKIDVNEERIVTREKDILKVIYKDDFNRECCHLPFSTIDNYPSSQEMDNVYNIININFI